MNTSLGTEPHGGSLVLRPPTPTVRPGCAFRAGTGFRWLLVFTLLGPVPAFALAPTTASAPAVPPPGLAVEIQTPEGLQAGRLLRLGAETGAELWQAGKTIRIPADQIGWLDFPDALDKIRAGDLVFFWNGDRLLGRVNSGTDQDLSIANTALGQQTLHLPLDLMSGIVFSASRKSSQAEELCAQAEAGEETQDRLVLANGDVSQGTYLGWSESGSQSGLRFKAKTELTVPRSLVQALVFSRPETRRGPATAPASRPHAPPAIILFLNDGTILSVRDLTCNGATLTGKLLAGDQPFEVAVDNCQRIEMPASRAGADRARRRFVWLSELAPAAQKHEPYVTLERTAQRDRSVLGTPLKVGGRTSPRGWGMQSAGRLRFDLSPPVSALVARVAMDDSGNRYSDADVRVLVDGKLVFEKIGLKKNTPPIPLRLDLRGARTLELVVDFGLYGDLGDHVDWLDAALVK